MMGRRDRDQGKLFYEFNLDDIVPADHLLRRMDVFVTTALGDLHAQLKPFYSEIGRPSIDPELMIRMLLVGYCFGIRSERRLCQESNCIWRTGGSANSISTMRSRTIPRSRPTGLAGSARATYCATSSSASCGRPWPRDW